ncbi:Transmembrane protein 167A [Nosema bombycis CQ1]|uniref:Protein kish n=1 Tax=Nosema bombycis (strain CQ1 / CVCC 102059) TaxID=578461 RepID=R0KYB4_NOSB1|nr:transmembrane protein 167A [Nosema bombycis CQ1]EOB15212.1 Transmembrane protein 167A [Nosema bombycis CQ1]|eukprot:EOB13092.1 transmembrane protein 167A [Nosema bombycis CQ1]
MSALFHLDALFRLFILLICTSTYIKRTFPSMINKNTKGFSSFFYKCSVVGERLSPYVAGICLILGIKKFISFFI